MGLRAGLDVSELCSPIASNKGCITDLFFFELCLIVNRQIPTEVGQVTLITASHYCQGLQTWLDEVLSFETS